MEAHKQALIDKLKETDSPSLVLHLVCLILYQMTTQNMLNASGRFVSNILHVLKNRLPPETNELLQRYHGELPLFSLRYRHFVCYNIRIFFIFRTSFESFQVERK